MCKYITRTSTATERAMQRWPAAPKAAPTKALRTDSCVVGGGCVEVVCLFVSEGG